ncbi:type I-A CRISPR-associated protein Cas8a2/Csx9 [Methanocaldococcus sp. 28A]
MIPIDGFTKEILLHGLSQIITRVDIDKIDNPTLAKILRNYLNSFKEKIKNISSSKLSRNDKISYTKTYQNWFNTNPPVEYTSLMVNIVEKTIKLLEENKIDAKTSLTTIKIEKDSINFGIPYKKIYAILPAIIKQVEFYEYASEFLTPTKGRKSIINLDPVWFSILSIGFLLCFAGYFGKKYYLMLKNDIERYYLAVKYGIEDEKYALGKILGELELLTQINIQRKFSLESEEIYELLLSMELAKRQVSLELFPVTLYVIELSDNNIYLAKYVLELNLRNSLKFMKKYINRINRYLMFESSDNKIPLEELLYLALYEHRNPISEDNENLAYIMVKDLYRAINSERLDVLENTLYLLLRKGHSISSKRKSKSKHNVERIFKNFAKESNIISILEGFYD